MVIKDTLQYIVGDVSHNQYSLTQLLFPETEQMVFTVCINISYGILLIMATHTVQRLSDT